MKASWPETLWNEEITRCEVVDIAEKVREAKLRRYGHVIRRDEGEPVRDIME
jgi:precorrin-4 methylase